MRSVRGTYDGQEIRLAENVKVDCEVEVIVTFLDDSLAQGNVPTETHFHFQESRRLLRDLKSSLTEEVIRDREER